MAFINGTAGHDVIRTAAAGGSLNGLPDATDDGDTIDAGAGDDIIIAGNGSDIIRAGAGQDQVIAGDGNDIIPVIDDDPVLTGQESDAAFGEEVDGGAGSEDVLFLEGLASLVGDTPTYDLTSWLIRDVEVLEFG